MPPLLLLSRFHAVCGTLLVLTTATFTAAQYPPVNPLPGGNQPIWETTPKLPITYRTGTIFYERTNFPSSRAYFLTKFWWLGLILVCVVAVVLYGALLLWICVHFKVREQYDARQRIAASYANGTFQTEAFEGRNQTIVWVSNGHRRTWDGDQCGSNGKQENGGSSEAQEQNVMFSLEDDVHDMPMRETSQIPLW